MSTTSKMHWTLVPRASDLHVGWDTIDRLPSLSLSVRREANGCRNRDRSPEVRITRKRIDYDYDYDNDNESENENEKRQKYGSQQSHATDGLSPSQMASVREEETGTTMALTALMVILLAVILCGSVVSIRRSNGWRRSWGGRSAKGPNGIVVSMDSRGLARLEWPREHKYIAVGLSLADDGSEPHDGQGGPPPVSRSLVLHADEPRITDTRDGDGIRVERVPEGQRETCVKVIREGLEALGYTVVRGKERQPMRAG